ncbi:MAG: DUF1343 domain-containing protein [Candidatus Aminicenantes bacterium]|nr:DUF1343 domain-containing protein [Candidatus Aminicenantes bacterium]
MAKKTIVWSLALALTAACSAGKNPSAPGADSSGRDVWEVLAVKTGVEVLFEKRPELLKDKRVGLITNPSGVDGRLVSTAERFKGAAGVKLVALYGPEHGIRGDAQAGVYVPFYIDAKFGLPVFSLYGPSMKLPPGMLKDIDEYMRSFDTTHADKKLDPSMTRDVDVLVFDIQDVGTRVYTYQATMFYALQAAAESGVEFVVLDRPNPLGGMVMEGPILEYPAFSSFVGLYPYPLRFGMTLGELARLANDKFLPRPARLTVVPMENWRRTMAFDETGLPWVAPSPNMPTLETATVYPGQVFFEGTNLSEGRGTTRPFEYFGAPWVDGHELARALNALGLPGVVFREQWFTPAFSKFAGERCGGCQVHVVDRTTYRPLETALQAIAAVRAMYPDTFSFHSDYFDKIMGTAKVREALERGVPVAEVVRGFEPGLREFEALRKSYLLY